MQLYTSQREMRLPTSLSFLLDYKNDLIKKQTDYKILTYQLFYFFHQHDKHVIERKHQQRQQQMI